MADRTETADPILTLEEHASKIAWTVFPHNLDRERREMLERQLCAFSEDILGFINRGR